LPAAAAGGDDKNEGAGLVPAAPPIGVTLYSDATVLRPMVPGAIWQYEGVDSDGTGYSSTVSQAAQSVGVMESSSNAFNGGARGLHLAAVDGNVVQLDGLDASGGFVDYDDPVELRSPVRVNDQFVIFELHDEASLSDSDGDGVGESFDMAMYRRVIGLETVRLAGLADQQAVRVDTVLAARAVLSRTALVQPVFTETTSTWYAPSRGIVRQTRTFVGPTGGSLVTSENLTGWSGLPD
jgi:hypothetical protein